MPELEQLGLAPSGELDEVVRKGYAAYRFPRRVQRVFTFATVDLSAFYFDIRKDALYCDGDTDAVALRAPCLISCSTA